MEYASKKFELGDDIRLQHLETSLDGVPVELHFFPCSMNNLIYHARLQKWFRRNADLQCSHIVGLPDGAGDIAIPTSAFNVVYQLTHLYHHFFDEGIGMRQIIDYFLVVNDFSKNVFLNTDLSNHPVPLSKEGSTFSPSPSSSGSGDVTALLGARNRYALRMADHQRSRQIVRDGTAWVLLACGLLMGLLQLLPLLIILILT